jgi:hypothetical protein
MRLRILAYIFDVFFREGIGTFSDDIAHMDPYKGEIEVDSLCRNNRPENDFMHEVFESLKWQLEIDLRHKDLTALANGLCAVLHDNPEFTRMFLGK